MKERSVEIVDGNGTRVLLLDGDVGGGFGVNGGMIATQQEKTWPLLAASVDTYIWTPQVGVWQVIGAQSIISVSGGTSAAVMVRTCSGVTAIASGVAQLSAALDLEETAPAKAVGTMVAAPGYIYAGDSLALDFSGTLTGLVGVISVYVKRVS